MRERERGVGEGDRRRMRRRGELLQRNSLNPLVSNSPPKGLLIMGEGGRAYLPSRHQGAGG
jgi:hypothetical protein